jgi:hypothetical protein
MTIEGETEQTLIPEGPKKSAKAVQTGSELNAVQATFRRPSSRLTSGHAQYSRLGRSVAQASCIQIVPGDAGKVDNDPTLFVGREESLAVGLGILSVDGVCDVGVDDESSYSLCVDMV